MMGTINVTNQRHCNTQHVLP